MKSSLCFSVVAVALSMIACSAPKKDLQVDEINKLTKLGDVMDVQATLADPQFKKHEQATFTDAELATLADVGTRLQATSLKAKEFSKGPEFDTFATTLHDHAAELVTAAQAKDAAAVRKTLDAIKTTCKGCHKKFR
jgi:cytochrome c556